MNMMNNQRKKIDKKPVIMSIVIVSNIYINDKVEEIKKNFIRTR